MVSKGTKVVVAGAALLAVTGYLAVTSLQSTGIEAAVRPDSGSDSTKQSVLHSAVQGELERAPLTVDTGEKRPENSEAEPWTQPGDGRHINPRDYTSATDLLADYWGPRWEEVEAELTVAGVDLGAYPLEDMPTWFELQDPLFESIAERMDARKVSNDQQLVPWTQRESLVDLAKETYGYSSASLEHLSQQEFDGLLSHTEAIREVRRNMTGGLHLSILDSLQQPDETTVHPIAYPRVALGETQRRASDYADWSTIAMNGWVIEIGIKEDLHPEYVAWSHELEELERERDELLAAAFDA